MGWILLLFAILTEVVATLSLRAAGNGDKLALATVVLGYVSSIVLLGLVVKHLEVSVAYAVWAGLGTALVAVFGVAMLGEPATAVKIASLSLIIAGVIGLNLSGAH